MCGSDNARTFISQKYAYFILVEVVNIFDFLKKITYAPLPKRLSKNIYDKRFQKVGLYVKISKTKKGVPEVKYDVSVINIRGGKSNYM